jgi:hypothetical protein
MYKIHVQISAHNFIHPSIYYDSTTAVVHTLLQRRNSFITSFVPTQQFFHTYHLLLIVELLLLTKYNIPFISTGDLSRMYTIICIL